MDDASFDPFGSTTCLKGFFSMLKPSLPTLVDIYIECVIEDEFSSSPFRNLWRELKKMAGQNVVETFNLKIWTFPGFDGTKLGVLDDVLMGSPEDWPALRKVSLSLNVVGISRSRDSKMVERLRELSMTKLMESKRVQFDYQVRDKRC